MTKRAMTFWAAASLLALCFACGAKTNGSEGASKGAGGGRAGSSNSAAGSVPATGGGGASGTAVWADDRPNGLLPISATQATAILGSPDTACAGWAEEPEGEASVLEFIVDVSGSMNEDAPSTNGESKWFVTRRALAQAVADLPASLAVGMTFYPNMSYTESNAARPIGACVNTRSNVDIAPLTEAHQSSMLSTLDRVVANPRGATPTHDAYDVAFGAISTTTQPGERYLVLITDGQPTQRQGCIGEVDMCNPQPTDPIVAAIGAALADHAVRTYVVGSPGSESNVCTGDDVRDWLSAAARAGGTSAAGCSDGGPDYCHFDLSTAEDFGQALSDALGSIARSVVSCDYSVPPPPDGEIIDTQRVNMLYQSGDGSYQIVLPSNATTCTKGWQFLDEGFEAIRVCPETCKLLQSDPKARVNLVFGCTQSEIQVPLQ